jgi:hypothetical protein
MDFGILQLTGTQDKLYILVGVVVVFVVVVVVGGMAIVVVVVVTGFISEKINTF